MCVCVHLYMCGSQFTRLMGLHGGGFAKITHLDGMYSQVSCLHGDSTPKVFKVHLHPSVFVSLILSSNTINLYLPCGSGPRRLLELSVESERQLPPHAASNAQRRRSQLVAERTDRRTMAPGLLPPRYFRRWVVMVVRN